MPYYRNMHQDTFLLEGHPAKMWALRDNRLLLCRDAKSDRYGRYRVVFNLVLVSLMTFT